MSQTVSHWLHTKTTKDRNTENEAASNFGKVTAKHDECGFFGDEQKFDLFAGPINVSRVHKELLLGMLSPILTWTMSGLPSGMGWILRTKDRRLVPDFLGHMNSSKHGAYGIINWKQNSYPKTAQTEIVASQLAKKLLKLFTSKPISRCIGRFWSKLCV